MCGQRCAVACLWKSEDSLQAVCWFSFPLYGFWVWNTQAIRLGDRFFCPFPIGFSTNTASQIKPNRKKYDHRFIWAKQPPGKFSSPREGGQRRHPHQRKQEDYTLLDSSDDVSTTSWVCAQVRSKAEHCLRKDLDSWWQEGTKLQESPRMRNWTFWHLFVVVVVGYSLRGQSLEREMGMGLSRLYRASWWFQLNPGWVPLPPKPSL